MHEHACQVAFGHEGDDTTTIARRVRQFQPDGIVVRKGKITREVLEASPRLRAVCKHGVGIDNIDVEAATELGIPVMITASANFESVAEHALALILTLLRNIHLQHAYTRSGGWDKSSYQGADLLGKTLGLVGFGRIGRRLCELVEPFRMETLVYDPYLPSEQLPARVNQVTDLSAMLPLVDVLSIHVPLTPETARLIGRQELALLRPQAYLVNTARGGVVDEAALIRALQEGKIRGAALDTFEQEPPDPGNPLLGMDNVVVSNHVGGSSRDALTRMGVGAVRNVLDILSGKELDQASIINPEALESQLF
jgi:D-3-phosphoglycerate dehydrogenase